MLLNCEEIEPYAPKTIGVYPNHVCFHWQKQLDSKRVEILRKHLRQGVNPGELRQVMGDNVVASRCYRSGLGERET